MKRIACWMTAAIWLVVGSAAFAAANEPMDALTAQQLLNGSGYDCGAADGIIGDRTLQALKRFQRMHNIYDENGQIGTETAQALKNAQTEKRVLEVLLQQAPELQEVVTAHRETDLIFYLQDLPHAEAVDRYARDYYRVYIGFRAGPTSSRMATFLLKQDFSEVLYDNAAQGGYSSLAEWRKARAAETAARESKQSANDWLCIPLQRVGPIRPTTTAQELATLFGEANVERRTIRGAEGADRYDVSIIYPGTPNELTVFWRDNRYGIAPSSIQIKQAGTAWKMKNGITIGTTAAELNQCNGKPFTISGFGWDYGGSVSRGWNGGLLGAQDGFSLQLRAVNRLPQELYGEAVRISSDDPRILPDAVTVGAIWIDFAQQ